MGSQPDTAELLERAGRGEAAAVDQLLARHRPRLRKMVAVRMDARLAARVDPSDVVQETIIEAARQLDDYLRERPLPFYAWLRRLAWQRLVDLHRRHVRAARRSIQREQPGEFHLPNRSAQELADVLAGSAISPSAEMLKKEMRQRVRAALDRLPPRDREVLILLYLEQLSLADCAAVLEISKKATTMRHLRALDRLRTLLDE